MGLTNIILSERQLQTEPAAALFYDPYVLLQGPCNIIQACKLFKVIIYNLKSKEYQI